MNQQCQQLLADLFNSFCTFKKKAKAKKVWFQGENFVAFSLGPVGAIGVNFDPFIMPDEEGFEQNLNPHPRFLIWETMPEVHDLITPVVSEIKVGRPRFIDKEEIYVKKGESTFPEMRLFLYVIETAEFLLGKQLVRV